MENKIRSTLNEIYFGKTKDIVNTLRSMTSSSDKVQQVKLQTEIVKAIGARTTKGKDEV